MKVFLIQIFQKSRKWRNGERSSHAGKENYFYTLRLQEENDKMKVNLASALNTLKLVLEGLPQLTFMFDDDGDVEEPDVTPPEKEKRDMEVA